MIQTTVAPPFLFRMVELKSTYIFEKKRSYSGTKIIYCALDVDAYPQKPRNVLVNPEFRMSLINLLVLIVRTRVVSNPMIGHMATRINTDMMHMTFRVIILCVTRVPT